MAYKDLTYNNNSEVTNDNVRNGTAEVNNGRIIVKNPDGNGRAAVLTCSKYVKLFVNDIEIKGSSTVFEDSKIRVEVRNIEPERSLEVSVEDDNMCASAVVHYKDGEQLVLKDKLPTDELLLETVSSCGTECPRMTVIEANALLKDKGIVYGIIEENLLEATSGKSDQPNIIAKGLKPVDGTDDRIEARFDEDRKLVEINDRVDFYSIGKVVSVEPGQLVAEKVPGRDGSPGMDVLGNTMQPEKGKKITLNAGRGTRISQDGLKAYSNMQGRPEVRGEYVNVYEVYEVQSDVDVSTGNIEFIGDVIIKGNIAEGMKVKAGNSVVLFGGITGGEITAGGDVTIYKNVISSKVRAGCSDFLRYNIIESFESISKNLISIFSAVGSLKETGKVPKIYKDGEIIKLLVDTKFNHLTTRIIELKNLLTDNKEIIDSDTLRAGAAMVKYFTGKGPTLIENYFKLKDFTSALDNQVEALKDQLKQPANITANYVQNSNLTTSGSIKIIGRGCYTSDLNCRGDIIIDKIGSVTRGGTISAGGVVKIYELGSQSGALTTVATGKDYAIYCEVAHINSVIRIGDMSNKLDASAKKLKAYRYKGELMVEKSKI